MSERAGAPSDAAERERAVMHEGSVLVQAPAGSGKTTLLVQRFLRVLAAVDAPERVLALTFTRRAALEMRERIVRALEEGASAEATGALDPFTRTLAAAAARHLAALGIDLAAHPSRLRVETIDAFNAWLAGSLPIGSGLGARPRVADDPRPLYQEAARRALAHCDDDPFGAAVERVLALGDQRHEVLARLVVAMLPGRERWLPLLAGGLRAAGHADESELAAA
ncbi:MAG TPA: UvrD-helicase domain-containing protein, partial [Ideonella sp.]|nr:UvrD-helicase domain-containing protein [Ideonella sp.]